MEVVGDEGTDARVVEAESGREQSPAVSPFFAVLLGQADATLVAVALEPGAAKRRTKVSLNGKP